jgi:LasA protease
LLLALLEYQSGNVHGQPGSLMQTDYPIGYVNTRYKGLYSQLNWAVQQLSIGYYGWRAGLVTELTFRDSTQPLRMAPELNAGTAALQYLFAQLYNQEQWSAALYGEENFAAVHERMFGNPWLRAQTVEPLYPTNLTQPVLELPFLPGKTWAYSGGPHSAWGPDGALAALDFAPGSVQGGCVENDEWVTASASGLVTRAADGLVVQDLDADGHEQTGWVLVYLHVATKGRVAVGSLLNTNDRIGHPSCEGGKSTGTHVHVARKYNGEWILADGPIPYVLSGWVAAAGEEPYKGTLTKGDVTAIANVYGSRETLVYRSIEP